MTSSPTDTITLVNSWFRKMLWPSKATKDSDYSYWWKTTRRAAHRRQVTEPSVNHHRMLI